LSAIVADIVYHVRYHAVNAIARKFVNSLQLRTLMAKELGVGGEFINRSVEERTRQLVEPND
jgi:hypothetical protein